MTAKTIGMIAHVDHGKTSLTAAVTNVLANAIPLPAPRPRHVYREGDRVRVVVPRVFLRCGYPYDIKAEAEKIGDAFAADIVALIDKVDPRADGPTPLPSTLTPFWADESTTGYAAMDRDYQDLCGRIARIVARRRRFGGRERSIYTEEKPELAGQLLVVQGKHVCKTGRYYPPGGSYDDYEPGGLTHEQTHVILHCGRADYLGGVCQIEASNVEPAN